LDNKWQEYDELLLHAAFQVLVDFLEKDHVDIVNWDGMPDTKKAWAEMQSLYKWWTKDRPNRKRREPSRGKGVKMPKLVPVKDKNGFWTFDKSRKYDLWRRYCKNIGDFETLCEQEDQENLKRLVDIRRFLWV
jgi:hypothetical protein